MTNMSYCRFRNTLEDLEDCSDNILKSDLSEEEELAREQLIALCWQIVQETSDEHEFLEETE